jgi:hypothetical protein
VERVDGFSRTERYEQSPRVVEIATMLGVVSQAITLGNVARTCVSKPGRAHAIAPARALERCALSVSTRPVHATPRADNSAVGAPSPTPGSSVPCSAALVKTLHHMSMALVDPPGPRHASALHRPRPSRYTPTPPSPPRSFAVWSKRRFGFLARAACGHTQGARERQRAEGGGITTTRGDGGRHGHPRVLREHQWQWLPHGYGPQGLRHHVVRLHGALVCSLPPPPPSRAGDGHSRLSRFIARLSPPPRSVEPKP